MVRWVAILVCSLGLCALVSTSALAGKRVALVIGNGVYANAPALPNPTRDASDVAEAFGRLGFTVTKKTDATGNDMRRALLAFGREATGAEMAVVFFAGHGMEIGGENWLIPVDAELRSDTDVDNEAIGLRNAMTQVAKANGLGMVILDACRNNPFASTMQRTYATRAVERGLTRVEPPSDNVLVAYAARDGTTASDGEGRNSPFTAALLKNIETPGLEVRFLFSNVRDDVMKATKRVQQPFVYASLSGEQIFLKPATLLPVVSAVMSPPSPALDEIAWKYIDRNSAASLRQFASEYPASVHIAEARNKIAALEGQPTPGNNLPVAVISIDKRQSVSDPIKRLKAEQLCFWALNSERTSWDPYTQYADHIAEAKARGLTVGECRVALKVDRPPAKR